MLRGYIIVMYICTRINNLYNEHFNMPITTSNKDNKQVIQLINCVS